MLDCRIMQGDRQQAFRRCSFIYHIYGWVFGPAKQSEPFLLPCGTVCMASYLECQAHQKETSAFQQEYARLCGACNLVGRPHEREAVCRVPRMQVSPRSFLWRRLFF